MKQYDFKASKVVALFLVQFDVKSGYNLLWRKSSIAGFNFDGLDYKAMPSGIHDMKESTVLLCHSLNNKKYYGFSRFQQHILEDTHDDTLNSEISRDRVKMYSLGILCEPRKQDWIPNDPIQNGLENIDIINTTLSKFLKSEDYDNFNSFEELFHTVTSTLNPPNSTTNHLLNSLPDLIDSIGPLIFEVYKLALLRKKIVIFNNPLSKVDLFTSGAFTYLISLLAVIPEDTKLLSKDSKNSLFSQTIYNVGLNDLSGPLLKIPGFIGSTNDEVIMYQSDVYDVGIFLPSNSIDSTTLFNSSDIQTGLDFNKRRKATIKDYKKFKVVHNELFGSKNKKPSNESNDDLASINTSTSILSYFRNEENEYNIDPEWWLKSATSTMSWREYLWSAFSWFASAGQVRDECISASDQEDTPTDVHQRIRLIQFINIISYFHKLTKKWYYLINAIVLEVYEDHTVNMDNNDTQNITDQLIGNKKVDIELTYQDIIEMELDPYSEQDLQFAKEFVLFYWGSIVESVEVGIGVDVFCC